MSILTNHMLMAAAGAQGGALDVADVFSTDLWTGASAAVTVTNGVNLAGRGGMVWGKRRDSSGNNWINDTVRNAGKIYTNSTQKQYAGPEVASYNSDGFTTTSTLSNDVNYAGTTHVAWTFRKAPKFFDVVTYTGDGNSYQTIPHNLGIEPGLVLIKRTDETSDWYVGAKFGSGWHYAKLNSANSFTYYSSSSGVGFPDRQFNPNRMAAQPLGSTANVSGATYIAYLFAHDPSPEGLIQCGSYTGTQAAGNQISLGWEPQFLLLKSTTTNTNWEIWDASRDASGSSVDPSLYPNTNQYEQSVNTIITPNATGFALGAAGQNLLNQTYTYMAIRAEGV